MVMKKTYCNNCSKYRKFKNNKIYIFDKALVLSIICGKCESNDEKIFKDVSIEILKILD